MASHDVFELSNSMEDRTPRVRHAGSPLMPSLHPANCCLSRRYFRSGAPSVINPLHTHFPKDTAVPGSFALTLTWTLPNRTTGVFNVTSPLPGDWFLAAHLPKDEGKISVKVKGLGGPLGWQGSLQGSAGV